METSQQNDAEEDSQGNVNYQLAQLKINTKLNFDRISSQLSALDTFKF